MLDACGQNIMTSADFDDLGAVKSMMAVGVTLDRVLSALKLFTPKSGRLALESWRDRCLLQAVAESFMLPFAATLIESWSKTSAKAPEKPVQKLKPLAGTSARSPRRPQAAPSDARVRHMRERINAQVSARGALADKSATRNAAAGSLSPIAAVPCRCRPRQEWASKRHRGVFRAGRSTTSACASCAER
jgi:hypothetical protein